MGIQFDHLDFNMNHYRPMSVNVSATRDRTMEKRRLPLSRKSLVQIDIIQDGRLEIRMRDFLSPSRAAELHQNISKAFPREYRDLLVHSPGVQQWVAQQRNLAGHSFSSGGSDTEEDEARPSMTLPTRPQIMTSGTGMQQMQLSMELTPTKRKRYDSDQTLSSDISPYPETQAATRSASMSLRVSDDDAVLQWYRAKFAEIQQQICKFIAKDWIKVVEPRKQSNHPYKNRDDSKPGWWPDGVEHIEPDHLKKDQRLTLLVTLIELATADPTNFEAATSANKDLQLEGHKQAILKDIYKVARARKIYKNDPSNKWNATQAVSVGPAVEKSADKAKSHIKRPKRDSSAQSTSANWFNSTLNMSTNSSFSLDESKPRHPTNPYMMGVPSLSSTTTGFVPAISSDLHPPYSLTFAFPSNASNGHSFAMHPQQQQQHDLSQSTSSDMFHSSLSPANNRSQVWQSSMSDATLSFPRWSDSFTHSANMSNNGMHFGHSHNNNHTGGHITPSSAGSSFELSDLHGVSPVTSVDTVATTTHSMARDQSFSTMLDSNEPLLVPDVSCDSGMLSRTASLHDMSNAVSFQPMGSGLD